MTETEHIVRVHASVTDNNLPEVAIPRLRDAIGAVKFNIDVDAQILPRRPALGQPRHQRIIARFTFNPDTRFEVPTADLTEQQVREHLGWTSGTFLDYPDDSDNYDSWEAFEDDAVEKPLSERPLPDTVTFDYYDDSAVIDRYGITVSDYFDTDRIVDDTTDLAVKQIAQQVLYDVDWYVAYHSSETDADGIHINWTELTRTPNVPNEL
jgi:hypothetical protein